MAWKANITGLTRNGITLNIAVHYSDDQGNTLDDIIAVSSPQSDDWIQGQVSNKIQQLANMDAYQTTVNKTDVTASTISLDSDNGVVKTPVATPIISTPSVVGP